MPDKIAEILSGEMCFNADCKPTNLCRKCKKANDAIQSLIAQREATTVGALKFCCEEERDARDVAKTILTEQEVEGDSYGVPALSDIMEILVSNVSTLRLENEALKQQGKAMEEALRDAKLQIEYLHDKFKETGSGNAVIAKIDAALEGWKHG